MTKDLCLSQPCSTKKRWSCGLTDVTLGLEPGSLALFLYWHHLIIHLSWLWIKQLNKRGPPFESLSATVASSKSSSDAPWEMCNQSFSRPVSILLEIEPQILKTELAVLIELSYITLWWCHKEQISYHDNVSFSMGASVQATSLLKGLWHGRWSTHFRSCVPHS